MTRLLTVLCFLTVVGAAVSMTIHRASINVDSHKTVHYKGSAISIFKHQRNPNRFFYQPLGLLDSGSIRLVENPMTNLTTVHFDVYLWTAEFISLVKSQIPSCESVELMPLLKIRLNWNQQAPQFLGRSLWKNFKLLDAWEDGDKPRQKLIATINCKESVKCQDLATTLRNMSVSVYHHIFDLEYLVHVDWTKSTPFYVRSNHFEKSHLFQKAEKFVSLPSSKSSTVILARNDIATIMEEVFLNAVADLENNYLNADSGSKHMTIDEETHAIVLDVLSKYLKEEPVDELTKTMWDTELYWSGLQQLRPDRLARLFNRMFLKSKHSLDQVAVTANIKEMLEELQEEMPETVFVKIRSLAERFLPSRPNTTVPFSVKEIEDLATDLETGVTWDPSTGTFVPLKKAAFFRINIVNIRRKGIFLLRNIKVFQEQTTQRDPVTAMTAKENSSFVTEDWKILMETTLNQRLAEIDEKMRNFTDQYNSKMKDITSEIRVTLTEMIREGPVAPRRSHEMLDPGFAPPESPVRYVTDAEVKTMIQSELLSKMSNISSTKQNFFAKDFCILSNGQNPPNMRCDVLSFVLPKNALRKSVFKRKIRYDPGRIGDNYFLRIDDDYFGFSLSICCTRT